MSKQNELNLDGTIDDAFKPDHEQFDISEFNLDNENGEESKTADDVPERSQAGGGDIDEPDPTPTQPQYQAPAADYNERRRNEIKEANDIHQAWKERLSEDQQILEDVQEEYKELKKKLREGDESVSDEDEVEAQQAIIDARLEVERSRASAEQAQRYAEQQERTQELSPAAQAWLSANSGRYGPDAKFTQQAQKTMQDLINDGMDPQHQNFYRQLDKRMTTTPRMNQKGPVRTAGTSGRSRRSGNALEESDGKLSDMEEKFIRGLNYDPGKKEVREEFVKAKRHLGRILREQGVRL